jgi:hypothetical protein
MTHWIDVSRLHADLIAGVDMSMPHVLFEL